MTVDDFEEADGEKIGGHRPPLQRTRACPNTPLPAAGFFVSAGADLRVEAHRFHINAIYKWEMPFMLPIMTAKLTLDKAGRVVIPKPLRDKMHLAPGDSFQLESTDEEIVLRPVRQELSLRKEYGIWVAHGGPPLSAEMSDSVLQSIRDERDAQNLGDR